MKYIYSFSTPEVMEKYHESTPRLAAAAMGFDKLYYDSKIIVVQSEAYQDYCIGSTDERMYILSLPNEIDKDIEILAAGDRLIVKSTTPFAELKKRYEHDIITLLTKPMRFL